MGASDVVQSTVVGRVRPYVRRVALALGVGFLVLVVVPVSTAAVVVLSGGSEVLALGLGVLGVLGALLVLVALPLAAVGLAWLVGLATLSALGTYATEQRLGALRRVEAVEEARWWGPIVRPSARLSFLDPRTAEERFEADLDEAKAAYVAGDVAEAGLERRLDRLFGLEPTGNARGDAAVDPSSPSPGDTTGPREVEELGRSIG